MSRRTDKRTSFYVAQAMDAVPGDWERLDGLTTGELAVWRSVVNACGQSKTFTISYAAVAARWDMGYSTVQRAVPKLRERGLITTEKASNNRIKFGIVTDGDRLNLGAYKGSVTMTGLNPSSSVTMTGPNVHHERHTNKTPPVGGVVGDANDSAPRGASSASQLFDLFAGMVDANSVTAEAVEHLAAAGWDPDRHPGLVAEVRNADNPSGKLVNLGRRAKAGKLALWPYEPDRQKTNDEESPLVVDSPSGSDDAYCDECDAGPFKGDKGVAMHKRVHREDERRQAELDEARRQREQHEAMVAEGKYRHRDGNYYKDPAPILAEHWSQIVDQTLDDMPGAVRFAASYFEDAAYQLSDSAASQDGRTRTMHLKVGVHPVFISSLKRNNNRYGSEWAQAMDWFTDAIKDALAGHDTGPIKVQLVERQEAHPHAR